MNDNGCGFDTSGVFSLADGQFGLMGMRERARAAERTDGSDQRSRQAARKFARLSRLTGSQGIRCGRQRFLNRLKTLLNPVRT